MSAPSYWNFIGQADEFCRVTGRNPYEMVIVRDQWGVDMHRPRREVVAEEMAELHLKLSLISQVPR